MTNKLSYAWVRNTPLFKSVSTGLTFDEKHKLAVDLMEVKLADKYNVSFNYESLYWAITSLGTSPQGYDYWMKWIERCHDAK